VTDVPIDPRIEKLIASLYGELPPDDERALKAELADDAALRAEWDELVAARGLLRGWEIEEAAPSFVLVGGDEPARARRRAPGGFWARLSAQVFRPLPVPAVALAAALALLAALALGRFRVERLERGLALRDGDAAPADVAAPATRAVTGAAPAPAPTDAAGVPSADSPYLTRQEFDAYSTGIAKMVVAALNEYRVRDEEQMTHVINGLYDDLSKRQRAAYSALSDRLDAVSVGLAAEQTKTDAKLDDLIDQQRGEPLTPLNQAPTQETEEK
jgi:hypothetical protein